MLCQRAVKADPIDHEALFATISRGAEDDPEVQEAVRVLRAKSSARLNPSAPSSGGAGDGADAGVVGGGVVSPELSAMDVDELERQVVAAKRVSDRAEERVQSAKSARTTPYGR